MQVDLFEGQGSFGVGSGAQWWARSVTETLNDGVIHVR